VDDDADVRDFLVDTLSDLGHVVEAHESGAKALKHLPDFGPDLLLLDFAMPGMNGADVARAMRATHPDIPIVFVTGFAESDQLDAVLERDTGILRKPFAIEDLARIVEQHAPRA
jgi:CheY-like chemotaxis protein